MAVVLIVLGCVLAPLAGVAVWARNQVTNTDRYVRTVAPLASDPAIQHAVADQITAQIFTYLDVQGLTNQAVDALAERGVRPHAGRPAARVGGAAGQRHPELCPHRGRQDRPEPGLRRRLGAGQPGRPPSWSRPSPARAASR